MSEHYSQQVDEAEGKRSAEQLLALVDGLQNELDQLREQLAWSNRLSQLGMLSAAVAHETNNFLTPIRTYAQLALANPDDPRLVERALRAAAEGTTKANALAERVMSLAEPRNAFQTSVCRVDDAVASAIATVRPALKSNRVEVIAHVEPAESAIDALSLEQVLINLINNACQAMAHTTQRGRIEIFSRHSERRGVQLRVEDNGPGIPEAVRDRLFEAFASDPDRTASGYGLGLSICKQLLESCGGSIALSDRSARGACFEIQLPAVA